MLPCKLIRMIGTTVFDAADVVLAGLVDMRVTCFQQAKEVSTCFLKKTANTKQVLNLITD